MKDHPVRKFGKPALKICVSVLLAAYLLYRTDLELIWENIRAYPPGLLAAAFLLMLANSAVGAASLQALYKEETVCRIFLVTLKSCFYSMVLPGQLLGESTKVLLLSRRPGNLARRVSAVIVDKVLNSIVLLWLGTFGLLHTPVFDGSFVKGLSLAVSAGVTVFLFAGMNVHFCLWLGRVLDTMRAGRVQGILKRYLDIWTGYAKDRRAVICSGVFGLVYHLLINLVYCVLARGLSMQVSFLDFCWVNAMLTFILLLPVSVGGLGVREVSLAGMLGILGVSRGAAVSLSILLLFLQVLRALIGGGLLLAGKGH